MRKLSMAAGFLVAFSIAGAAESFEQEFQPMLNSTCLACHSNTALSPLNFTEVSYDLSDPKNRRFWARVYDLSLIHI